MVFARVAPNRKARFGRRAHRGNLVAGLTGATLVLPQGVAFASIAGLPPQYGFYTAMITPVVTALFGSSWHAVSGPTTAISALVFAALSGVYAQGSIEFFQAAVTLALLVGAIQFALGLARLGNLVSFVSHSVMLGFITGASLLIGLSQIRHALGLDQPRPEHLPEFLYSLMSKLSGADIAAVMIAGSALIIAILIKKIKPSWPNYLLALLGGTGVYFALGPLAQNVATIGRLDAVTPMFAVPIFSAQSIRDLASPALAIALVGLLEAMSIGKAIALKTGQDLDGNREFVGQDMSNIVGGFFGCYPGSASFTRSGVNVEAGAETPLSAIFAAGFLFLFLQLVAHIFTYVPIPAMAGVILLVAWNLINIKAIVHIIQTSRSEAAVAGITFAVALAVDLEFSIYCGILMSVMVFMDHASHPVLSIGAPDPSLPRRSFRPAGENNLAQCPQMMLAGLDGPMFIGSVDAIRRELRRIEADHPDQTTLAFAIRGTGKLDLPSAELLIEEAKRRRARGGHLYMQTKVSRTRKLLERYGVAAVLPEKSIHMSKGDIIADAVPRLDQNICASCTKRIFRECPTKD